MDILVDKEQMKQCDKNTIEHFGVPSLVLMERCIGGDGGDRKKFPTVYQHK